VVGNDKGEVTAIVCERMKLGPYDKSGRRRPVPIKGDEIVFEADMVIAAIGQEPFYGGIEKELGLATNKNATLQVDKRTLATNVEGVFAGGDCVTGPATVVEAIGAGKKAAKAIDRYLGGQGILYQTAYLLRTVEGAVAEAGNRARPLMLPVEERVGNFAEVEMVYDEKAARYEAARCMRCDAQDSGPNSTCPGCSS